MATKILTANGNAQISTAQSKFGGASGLFDGTGDYVSTPDDAAWALGTGKFTIEAFIRLPATGATHALCGQVTDGTNFWGIGINSTGNKLNFGSITAGAWDINITIPFTWVANTWYHIAVVRNGTTSADWFLFVDGIQGTNSLDAGGYGGTIFDSAALFQIGSLNGNLASDFNGYIDEVRFSKGVARWTANFTAPTAEYDTDANTDLLAHMNGTNGSTSFIDSSVPAVSVSDSITVSENITLTQVSIVSRSDTATVTESVTIQISSQLSVNDSITITEAVTMLVIAMPNVNDSATVTESITMLIPTLTLQVNDAITIVESVTVITVDLFTVNDSITVSENISFQIVSQTSVNDAITVTESTTILIPILTPSVSDSVTVSESITLLVNYTLNVNDSITATESVSMFIPTLKSSVNETISVSEYICIHPTTPYPLQSRNSTTFSQQSKNATDYNMC